MSDRTAQENKRRLHPADPRLPLERASELHLDYAGRPLPAMDLGGLSWSETADTFGASIILGMQGSGIAVQLETILFHRCPGLIPQSSVTNTGAEPSAEEGTDQRMLFQATDRTNPEAMKKVLASGVYRAIEYSR